jgi:ceramide glucosyltransferase
MGSESLFPWPPFGLLLMLSLLTQTIAATVAISWTVRRRRRARALSAGFHPPVSVLKPLRGVDESLEENLESFARLTYPSLQIIFAARDPDDPALAVARRVAARHPRRNIRILDRATGEAANPKVLLLEAMLPHATGTFCLISDSNVHIEPNDLQAIVAPMQDDKVGLVYQPVVGIGERSASAAMENFCLTEQSGAAMIFVKNVAGVDAVMGKGILFRRKALSSIGNFQGLRDVLAEDYLLGVGMSRAGWKLHLSHVPARAVHVDWSLGSFVSRHRRHAAMRVRLSPWTHPIELCTNSVALALAPLVLGGVPGAVMFAMVVAVKTLVDSVVMRNLRGAWPRWAHLPLIAVKDFVMAGLWAAGIFNNRVNWRGTEYMIRKGTRLIRIDPPEVAEPATIRLPTRETERRRAA